MKQSQFPLAPTHLRPPSEFVRDQVKYCYDDFIRRDRFESVGETAAVVEEVGLLLAHFHGHAE